MFKLSNTQFAKEMVKNGGKAVKYLSKNSPTILTGCAATGLVVAVALAIKATPAAIKKIKEEKAKHLDRLVITNGDQGVTEEEKAEMIEKVPLKKTEIIRATWKEYIPTGIVMFGTGACIIGANSINAKRTAAMAALYSMSETALKEYKDKAVEVVGKGKAEKIADAVADAKVKEVENEEIVWTGNGNTLMLESLTGTLFRSDIDAVKQAVLELNEQMFNGDYRISVNEYRQALGLRGCKLGDEMGWTTDGMIKLTFRSSLTSKMEPCLVLDHENMPGTWYFDS